MNSQAINSQVTCSAKYPISNWALGMQDFVLVSTFGIWFAVLGVSPLLIARALFT
jgi:hypothetical protein